MKNQFQPKNFSQYIGQEKIKKTLKVIIASSLKRKTQVDHILLYGAPGLGKTTLANIIAQEMKSSIRYAQGPLLDKKSDILSLFASIRKHDVIFIDEIHGINKSVEELLYSALDEGVVDIIIGTEGDSKIVRMKLPPFTLIGATTQQNKLSNPLKDRFGFVAKINSYTLVQICKIIKNSAKSLKLDFSDEAIDTIANFSGMVPRKANHLLKRIFDFATVESKNTINQKFVLKVFNNLGFYKNGLSYLQIQYLELLNNVFANKNVSIENLVSLLREQKINIEKEIEPPLLKKGYIDISSRGRKITIKGIKYISSYKLV